MREDGAERDRFFKIGHAKQLRIIGQRLRNLDHPVAVSVGFHNGQKLGGPDTLADNGGVLPQSLAIDLSPTAATFLRHSVS